MNRKPRRRYTLDDRMAYGMSAAVEVGECLEWPGPFSCNGATPCMKVTLDGAKRCDNIPVNRVLWERARGPIPEGMVVYRTCCNNKCVCLKHLALGTRAQWMAHRKKLGHTKHKQATKLKITAATRKRPNIVNTLEKARQVRALSGSMNCKEIAERTGVSYSMVIDICRGDSWRETVSNPFAGLMG